MKSYLLILICLLSLVSCRSAAKPRSYTINLSYDPVTIERYRVYPSLEVDVVEANETMLKQLEQTEIDEYFDPENMLRDSLRKKTYYFSEKSNDEKQLNKADPVWESWLKKRGATHLVLFVNTPRDGAKGPDMRRLTLPLAAERWDADEIDITIIPAGLMLQTPINPED